MLALLFGATIALMFNYLKSKHLNRYLLFPVFILLITFTRWYESDDYCNSS
jgi:hypothetical protein